MPLIKPWAKFGTIGFIRIKLKSQEDSGSLTHVFILKMSESQTKAGNQEKLKKIENLKIQKFEIFKNLNGLS